jgi:hypothetical protein
MTGARNLGVWTRFGLIASLFWVLGSAYYLKGANRQAYFQSHSKDCLALQKAPPPGFNLWACGAYNRAQWDAAGKRAWDGVALRALGPIPLAWLLAYGCVGIARGMRAGAKHPPAD